MDFEFDDSTSCPLCNQESLLAANGVLAPFVSTLIGSERFEYVRLMDCRDCNFVFFSHRYSKVEMEKIYSGYRSNEYFQARKHWEPWYQKSENGAYEGDSLAVRERNYWVTDFLIRAGSEYSIETAVDFGGDEGQFFPMLAIKEKIVCDPSEKVLSNEVNRIADIDQLKDKSVDLVLISHVLEHLPDPLETLKLIRRVMRPTALLYIEVPLDNFAVITSFHGSETYAKYLRFISSHRFLFITVDFMSGISRQFRSKIPKFGIVKQSEHINYYSKEALQSCLSQIGFDVVISDILREKKVGKINLGRLSMAVTLSE